MFKKMTYCRIHALCVRTKYPPDDSTITCGLNALVASTFIQKGGRLAPCGFFDAFIAVTQ